MTSILLINPNTSEGTTALMLAVARPVLPSGSTIRGVTATRGAVMILDDEALAASVPEVLRIGLAEGPSADALIVAAFADPGVEELRSRLEIPVVGIGEAAIREAVSGGRRFGIVTTTPALVGAIESLVTRLSVGHLCAGIRVPPHDPLVLAADPALQDEVLGQAQADLVEGEGAEAVVIGGGPLSGSGARLAARDPGTIIEPIPAAVRAVLAATAAHVG